MQCMRIHHTKSETFTAFLSHCAVGSAHICVCELFTKQMHKPSCFFFFPSPFTLMRLSWGWALSHSSCYPAVTSSWELEEPTHMLPSLSSQQHQHLCRTGQKAEDSNVFNCFCQQWRSFLTKSRAMYFLVEVHQPANDAILLSNAFTWGLWLINWNLHMTGNLCHNSLLQARKMQCGSLKGAFLDSLLRK